jgi:type I restriction enzyme S subunit
MKFRWETEFKETEIGEIPKDWEVKKATEYIDFIRGIEPGSKLYKNSGKYRFIRVGNLSGERESEVFIDIEVDNEKIANKNDILISFDGTVGIVRRGLEGVFSSGIRKIKIKREKMQELNYEFLYWFFKSTLKHQIFGFSDEKTTIAHASDSIPYLKILLPPLSEQSRIATVLSWFDDLIEVKKRQNEILEKTAMAIFKSWFIDFEPFRDGEFVYSEELGKEIPKGWEVKRIIDLSSIVSGRGRYLIEASEGIYPLWGANGVLGYIENYDLEGFSIITGRVGTLGNVFLVEGKFAISDNVLCIIPHQDFWVFFLFLWIKSQIDFESLNVGTSQPLITKTALGNQPLIFPPSHILQSFHSLVEPLFQKIILNQKQIMTLKKVRDTFLPLLVFGKLRVEEI